jgi:hypothetical protein
MEKGEGEIRVEKWALDIFFLLFKWEKDDE